MSKISMNDQWRIRQDLKLRKDNRHHRPKQFAPFKPNEYVMFLGRCISHANHVGDYEIANKILEELGQWNMVEIKDDSESIQVEDGVCRVRITKKYLDCWAGSQSNMRCTVLSVGRRLKANR